MFNRLGLLCLLALVAITYYPSLFHVARADHVSFLAEYAGRDNSLQTAVEALFYNRTREFSPGDAALFRPLLFLMLSLQRLVFGYGFFWWQLVALAAHLFTVWALWRLLRRWAGESIGAQAGAWVLTGFFAFLFANMEAVIWHGITPYVFFAGFILLAVEKFDVWIASGGEDRGALRVCAWWLLACVLVYEAAIWYIPCFFVFAWVALRGTESRRCAFVLLMPLAVYAAWSAGHWLWAGIHPDAESGRIAAGILGIKTASNFFMVLKWFVSGGFFLQPFDLLPGYRLMVRTDVFAWQWPFNVWLPVRWLGAAGLILLLGCAAMGARLIKEKKAWWRIGLVGAMLLGYLLLITAGRANVRQDGTGLHCSLYYFYNFWALFTVFVFLLVRPLFEAKARRAWVLAGLLVCCTASNSWIISWATASMAEAQRETRQLVILLDKFIAEHRNEPGFSFYVKPEEAGNYEVVWLTKKSDPPGKKYYFVEVLYPKYFNAVNPKYRLHGVIK